MTLRRRRWTRVLLIAAPILFIVYTLGGFFGVPLLITKVILPRVSERLHGEARVARVACNPFILGVTLEGLEVVDAGGVRIVGCERVYANLQASSLWRGGPHFRELSLQRPFVGAELNQQGRLNLADLVKPSDEPTIAGEAEEPWRVSADRLAITGGRVEFRDRMPATPVELVATPVDAVFEHFDTDPDNSNTHKFTASLGSGGTLAWEGDFFLDPLSSQGRIELAGLALEQFKPYLADVTTAELTRGVTGVTLGYRFAPLKTPQVAEVTLERYTLSDLALGLGGAPLLNLKEAVLEGVRADAVGRRLAADTLRITGARVRVERSGDGTLTVMDAMGASRGPGTRGDSGVSGGTPTEITQRAEEQLAEAVPAPRSPIARVIGATLELLLQALNPWAVRVEKVVLEDAALQWTDRGLPGGAVVEIPIEAIRLEAGPIRSEEGYRVPLTLRCRVAGSGAVEAAGRLGLESRDAELEVTVDGLPLPPFGAYLRATQPELSVAGGELSVRGRLTAAAIDPERPQLTYAGDFGLASLRIDTAKNEGSPLLAWDGLRLVGVRFDHAAGSAHVERVALDGLAGTVTRAAAPEEGQAPEPPESSEPAPPRYTVTVGEVHATSHELVLLDPTVEPAGRVTLAHLDATLRNVSSSGDVPAEVELRGTLQGEAALEAKGTVTPRVDAPGVDLALRITALPLTPFSGYTGEYIGFPVESGRLETDVDLKLDQRQLDAQLSLVLDRFHLGDRLAETDAPNLPVKLGLSLLRDRNDRIDLRVPIEGDLSDPSVSVGHLVVQAFVNTLVKIAASPFDFIAGAIGGGGGGGGEAEGQLDRVTFPAGGDTIDDAARRKLDLLAQALRDRPALTLVVRGGSTAADEPALRKEALLARVRADLVAALPRNDPRRADPAGIAVPPEQYRYAVERLADRVAGAAEGEAPPVLDEDVSLTIPSPPQPRRMVTGGRGTRSIVSRPRAAAPPPAVVEAPTEAPAVETLTEGGVPFAEVEASVLAAVPLPADALPQLAARRAEAVRKHLVEAGQVEAARVEVGTPAEAAEAPMVRFELR